VACALSFQRHNAHGQAQVSRAKLDKRGEPPAKIIGWGRHRDIGSWHGR
jgi:hypothetical protein